MDTNRLTVAYLLLCMAAVSSAHGQTIGLIQTIGDELWLTVDQPVLKGVVNFQYRARYDEKTVKQDMHVRCCLKLPTSDFQLRTKGPRNVTYRYRGKFPKKMDSDFVGAAILVPEMVTVDQANENTIQTKGLKAKTCWSSEGFHVMGYVGKKKVTDLYQGFDYSIDDPTCKEEE